MAFDAARIPQQGTLAALVDTIAGSLGACYARLYTNQRVYDPTDVCADYTEAAFVGYSPQGPLVWGAPFVNADGRAESDSNPVTWTYTAGAGTATCFGIMLTDLGKTKLLRVYVFAHPIVFSPTAPNLTRGFSTTDVSEL